MEAHFRAM